MAMTKEEKGTKNWLYQHLLDEGYATYAKLFWELDFHLTADPTIVGYMMPETGTITVNRNLDADQISVIIRHEILHGFLKHERRLLQNLARKRKLNFDELDNMGIRQLKQYLYSNANFNIAGDYEISNLGYTEEDKQVARNILLNGETVVGLVTEDDHPDWVDLSIEEMYDRLEAENPIRPPQQQGGSGGNGGQQQSDNNQNGDGQAQSGEGSESQPSQGKSGEESGEQQSNNQSNSGQGPNSSQSSKQGNRNGGNGQSSRNSSSGPKYVYGTFMDSNTFLDANGNPVTIG